MRKLIPSMIIILSLLCFLFSSTEARENLYYRTHLGDLDIIKIGGFYRVEMYYIGHYYYSLIPVGDPEIERTTTLRIGLSESRNMSTPIVSFIDVSGLGTPSINVRFYKGLYPIKDFEQIYMEKLSL